MLSSRGEGRRSDCAVPSLFYYLGLLVLEIPRRSAARAQSVRTQIKDMRSLDEADWPYCSGS